MTFWSGETLGARLPNLVTPYDPSQIDCAAYRLRVGPEIYVSPTEGAKDAQSRSKVSLELREAFTIPPGQFAFLLTEERVAVPNDALAFISVRATVKFRGLVNVSGFHVDPGYSGRLVFSVFNAGPGPVHLARGDDCFLIWFADLDRATALAKSGEGFDDIPTKLINPIAGEIQSFAGLLSKIEANERRMAAISSEQNFIRAIGLIIVAAILAWFFRGVAPPTHGAQPDTPAVGASATAASAAPAASSSVPNPLTMGQGSSNTVPPSAASPTPPGTK